MLTFRGAGFSPVLSENDIEIEDAICAPKIVNATFLVCALNPSVPQSNRRSARVSDSDSYIISPGTHLRRTANFRMRSRRGFSFFSFEKPLNIFVNEKPTIPPGGVSPSRGSVGGGSTITITGEHFAQDMVVTIGQADCLVKSRVQNYKIVCETASAPVGIVGISLQNPGAGMSDPSNIHAKFEYILAVSSVMPSVIGMGGGSTLTAVGEGMGDGVGGHISISGIETYVVGVFQASLVHEVHALELTGTYVDEIQTIDLSAIGSTFRFQLFDLQSSEISINDNAYLMQKSLNDDIIFPSGGRAQLTKQGLHLTIVFRGLGDVPMLETVPQASVSEKQRGVRPAGFFRLSRSVGSSFEDIATDASANTIKNAIESLYSEGLTVAKTIKTSSSYTDPTMIIWTITFQNFTGERDLPQITQDSLSDGEVTARRAQIGTAPVQGSWSISIDGIGSRIFDVRASAEEVEQDLRDRAFPSIDGIKVTSGDMQPGWKMNREYPRQWNLRLSRSGVIGLSAHRCTSPLFMDWSPESCPETAPDLYLNIHYYFWPALLPRPADLGEEQRTQRLQARCDSEARAGGLEPGFCQVQMIRESAPICGQGSGINPPCWVQRWSTANVTMTDGSIVTMERDDTQTPGDTTKGYRSWRRLDWLEHSRSRAPRLSSQVEGVGANMDVRNIGTLAEQIVPANFLSTSETAMRVLVPTLSTQTRPIAEAMLASIYNPELEFNSIANLEFLVAYEKAEFVRLHSEKAFKRAANEGKVLQYSGVLSARSKLIFADESALSFYPDSYIRVPFDLKHVLSMNPPCSWAFAVMMCERRKEMKTFTYHVNEPKFSIALWLWTDNSQSVPIVRSLRGSAGQGYALTLTADGLCRFWLGNGTSEYSYVSGSCPAQRMTHVTATFDGRTQALFIDGVISEQKFVTGNFAPNQGNSLYVGGRCSEGDKSVCPVMDDGQDFVGHLEQFRIYSAALSTSVIRDLVEVGNLQKLHATFQAHINGVLSKCSGDCDVGISPVRTPVVWGIHPKLAWTGREVTITGRGFAPDVAAGEGVATVKVGSRDCSVISATEFIIVCTVEAPPEGTSDKTYGSLPVHVMLPFRGRSLISADLVVTSLITGVTPSSGSMLGGTMMTLSGLGIPLDASIPISVDVGSHVCHVKQSHFDKVECELEMMGSTDDVVHTVSVKVDGWGSVCGIPSGCKWQQSAADTPQITRISPLIIRAGDLLTIDGKDLPLQGTLSIRIGDTDCTQVSRSTSTVQCRLGDPPQIGRYTGRQQVFVRYEMGYSRHAVDGCCPLLDVAYEISMVTPSRGSNLGGQHITISGSGFPSISGLSVFIGGKKSAVLSATRSQLIVETPRHLAGNGAFLFDAKISLMSLSFVPAQ